MIVRILVCFSLVAIAIPAASGCGTEQKGTFSPSTKGSPTSTVKGDEVAVSTEGKAEGTPPITQISVVAGTGADKAGFEYAPPLDPNPALSGEEAIAQAW